jgi:PKD repeat protein
MKKILIGLVVILIITLAAAGCSGAQTGEQSLGKNGNNDVVPDAGGTFPSTSWVNYEPGKGEEDTSYPDESKDTGESLVGDRMVVRSGNLELVVSDVAEAIDNIIALADENGGYVVSSQKWKEEQRNIGNITIRVLAENFNKAMAEIKNLAMNVTYETTTSQDVTEEYTDLESRLKNLEAAEAQLLKIMETAEETEDVLAIQRELTNVRGEIEQIQGRMQYLERTTETSLISVHLEEAHLAIKFSADKVRVDAGEKIAFISSVEGGFPPYNYQWDFGDGETSIEKNPEHSYSEEGYFSVTLTVSDDKGYDNSITREEYINVVGGWNPGGIFINAWDGFIAFAKVFVNVLIWILAFSPLWILIGVIVWLIIRRKRKKSV